jgi:autotransporter-associated beta strand protein
MTSATWKINAPYGNYNDTFNWREGGGLIPGFSVPGSSDTNDTAFFGTSTQNSISIGSNIYLAQWVFNQGASQYNFQIPSLFTTLMFLGSGIEVNGGSVEIDVAGTINFLNNSTAGSASIVTTSGGNEGVVVFRDGSTAGNANITNTNNTDPFAVIFEDDSSASNAIILTQSGAVTKFEGFSNGGNAQFFTDPGGTVDFSPSAGPAGNHKLTVGSINGGGTYKLGADQLTVLSGNVSGLIDGVGGSLVKVGHETLTLSGAHNTYSGGTTLEGGTLDLIAIGAAGTSDITFEGGAKHNIETLKIENAALFGHHFTNNIDFFGKHNILDLSGLKFHKGATAKYHPATDILDVNSGTVTDKFTLVSPLGTHFVAAKDGHGGTKVTLDPPAHTSTVASLATHDVAEQHWAGGASHPDDFLLVG